jgi:hypothetical protein
VNQANEHYGPEAQDDTDPEGALYRHRLKYPDPQLCAVCGFTGTQRYVLQVATPVVLAYYIYTYIGIYFPLRFAQANANLRDEEKRTPASAKKRSERQLARRREAFGN